MLRIVWRENGHCLETIKIVRKTKEITDQHIRRSVEGPSRLLEALSLHKFRGNKAERLQILEFHVFDELDSEMPYPGFENLNEVFAAIPQSPENASRKPQIRNPPQGLVAVKSVPEPTNCRVP